MVDNIFQNTAFAGSLSMNLGKNLVHNPIECVVRMNRNAVHYPTLGRETPAVNSRSTPGKYV